MSNISVACVADRGSMSIRSTRVRKTACGHWSLPERPPLSGTGLSLSGSRRGQFRSGDEHEPVSAVDPDGFQLEGHGGEDLVEEAGSGVCGVRKAPVNGPFDDWS